ncbi:hypothetical protein BGZ61DRAFT_367769 [Ilyonectria robusta]|uniref:uncharacterized protein n=1 Tax=Ilyonectria robusta TaxID=1079257 RepID=UPI001E8D93C5|nr:uncharacterized protein BGZ61DRAFT_367769 [Ilyonectria robusta]KAH8663232.1 hypothetical protein BGZ61DRAFT_367769 [Ilyonectria robusta]
MAESRVSEKHSSPEYTELDQNEQTHTDSSPTPTKSRPRRLFKYWPLLLAHTAGCIGLALALVFAVNHYNAIDTSTPRYNGGKLRLRVSDVTTLVSAGLVVIKFFTAAWGAIAVWRCAYELTQNPGAALSPKQLSFMTRYKLPPWTRYPFSRPKGFRSWAIALVLLFAVPQQFIAPLLSGAVNWNPSSVPADATVPVNSTDPSATSDFWYQYLVNSYAPKRATILRLAAGLASMAWSDSSTVSQNGTSLTGNGCRHVVNDYGLTVNSTLANSVVPCIKFHSISWAMSASEIPTAVADLVTSNAETLSLLNDTLYQYTNPGHAVLFNPDKLWDPSQYGLPEATLFSGPQSLGLLIANQYTDDCKGLDVNNFGDVDKIPQYKYGWALGTCFIFANVTLSAGVTTSKVSTYVTSRVVEDQTPIDEVVLKANRWVQQSLWLLPDLMTMVSSMNSTLLPTWDNIDHYAENLIRQCYLAAWDSFHRSFDTDGTVSPATPRESRVQATVSNSRVISWLAISLLHTIGGILLISMLSRPEPEIPNGEDSAGKEDSAGRVGGTEAGKDIMNNLAALNFL